MYSPLHRPSLQAYLGNREARAGVPQQVHPVIDRFQETCQERWP